MGIFCEAARMLCISNRQKNTSIKSTVQSSKQQILLDYSPSLSLGYLPFISSTDQLVVHGCRFHGKCSSRFFEVTPIKKNIFFEPEHCPIDALGMMAGRDKIDYQLL